MAAPLVSFLRELWQKYRQDHVSILVSSLAYYTFFSFFPLMLLLASIIGFLFGMGEEYARLPRTILGLLPFSSDYMSNAVDRIVHARRKMIPEERRGLGHIHVRRSRHRGAQIGEPAPALVAGLQVQRRRLGLGAFREVDQFF